MQGLISSFEECILSAVKIPAVSGFFVAVYLFEA